MMHANGGTHLVRVLDGHVRAFLSDRYRLLDHYDVAMAALRAVRDNEGVVLQGQLSERSMRIKFTTPEVHGLIEDARLRDVRGFFQFGQAGTQESRDIAGLERLRPVGPNAVYPTVTIVNSETGHGAFRVQYGILLAYCLNTAVHDEIKSEVHLGGVLPVGVLRAETIELKARAINAEAVDAIAAAFNKDRFAEVVGRLNESASTVVPDAVKAVDHVMKLAPVQEGEREALLAYFARDYSQTRFGLGQAVSRLSQDVADIDRSADLERVAGQLMLAAA
jgi:hypothetical protein